MNIVLDDAVEEKEGGEKVRIGMVVRTAHQNHSKQHKMARKRKGIEKTVAN